MYMKRQPVVSEMGSYAYEGTSHGSVVSSYVYKRMGCGFCDENLGI